jgi:hypothetical protein
MLACLLLLVCGPVLVLTACVPLPVARAALARDLERRCRARVLLPVLCAAIAAAVLGGWALQEPDATDEWLTESTLVVGIFSGFVVVRAAARLLRAALRRPDGSQPAYTIGLLRPRVVISGALSRALSPSELAAVVEHEAAHARHRDPLGILVMQLAADLQWPAPFAARRMRAWRRALELARDEEACARGACAEDLAAGILAGARLARDGARAFSAAIVESDADALRERVYRLLSVRAWRASPPARRLGFPLVAALLLGGGVFVGCTCGESTVRGLPGVVAQSAR